MVSICKHTRSMDNSKYEKGKHSFESIKKNAIAAMTLAIVFGLGWAFGLAATIPIDELNFVFQVLFCFAVGCQGVLIFLLHGVKNKDFRDVWIQTFNIFGRKTRPSSTVISAKNALTVSHTLQHTTSTDQELTTLDTLPQKKDLAKGVDRTGKSLVTDTSMGSRSIRQKM